MSYTGSAPAASGPVAATMSRHNTRNKNKRPRSDESNSPSAAVFKYASL